MDIVNNIGAGQDFETLALWIAAAPNDGNNWVGNMTDAGTYPALVLPSDNIGGIELRADKSIAYNPENPTAPHVTFQGAGSAFTVDASSPSTVAVLRDIEFDSSSVADTCVHSDVFYEQDITIIGGKIKGGKNGVKNYALTGDDNFHLENVEIEDQVQAGAWLVASNSSVDHCTVHDANTSGNASLGGIYALAGVTVSNTVCYNNGNKDFETAAAANNNNASGDTSSSGAGSITGIVDADFEDTASGVYTAAVGGALEAAGTGGSNIGIEAGIINALVVTTPTSNYHYGRSRATNSATVTITGTYDSPTIPTAIEYSLDGLNYSVLDAAPAANAFTGSFEQPVGVTDIYLRFANATDVNTTLESISVGIKVLTLPSQSNFVGAATQLQSYTGTTGYFKKYTALANTWEVGADPFLNTTSAGSLFPLLANKMVAAYDMPVGFVNASSGSTSLAQWQPAQTLNDRLLDYINDSGDSDFELAIGWIGEQDANLSTDETTFKAQYNTVIDQFKALTGVDCVLCGIAQVGADSDNIRQWTSEIVASNANALGYVDMSLVYSGIHYETPAETDGVATALFDGISTAFFTSQLNLTIAGIGSTTESIDFFDRITKKFVSSQDVVFTGDSATVNFSLPVGSVVGGFQDGINPPTTGTGTYGVTE